MKLLPVQENWSTDWYPSLHWHSKVPGRLWHWLLVLQMWLPKSLSSWHSSMSEEINQIVGSSLHRNILLIDSLYRLQRRKFLSMAVPVAVCAACRRKNVTFSPHAFSKFLQFLIWNSKSSFESKIILYQDSFFFYYGLKNLKLPLDSSAVTAQSQAVQFALTVLIGLKTGRALRWLDVLIKWAYSRHNNRKWLVYLNHIRTSCFTTMFVHRG